MKSVISTPKAPKALGPYSQAIRAGQLIFCAGQIGIDPASGELQTETESQIAQAFANLQAILAAAKCELNDVVKLNLYLISLKDFGTVNEICQRTFSEPYPARATVEVAHLPLNASFEVDAIAYQSS